jgi:hypothetical protein
MQGAGAGALLTGALRWLVFPPLLSGDGLSGAHREPDLALPFRGGLGGDGVAFRSAGFPLRSSFQRLRFSCFEVQSFHSPSASELLFGMTPGIRQLLLRCSTSGIHAVACPSPLRGQLRCSRRSCGAVPKKVTKKARHRTRCPAAPRAPLGAPALLGWAGLLRQYAHVLLRKRGDPATAPALLYLRHPCRRHRRAPVGLMPPSLRCSASRTAPGIQESVPPWTTSTRKVACSRLKRAERLRSAMSLLRQDAA